jgi:hypothetical protein
MHDKLLHLETKNVKIEPLRHEDVEFLFELRSGARSKFMKSISPNINDQYAYFGEYLKRYINETEIYYLITDKITGVRAGVVRLTEIDNDVTFCWESLVTKIGTRAVVAIDAICLIYHAGFKILGRKNCSPFRVPKQNDRVIKLHEIMGLADRVGDKDDYWLYHVTEESYVSGIGRLSRMGFGNILQ